MEIVEPLFDYLESEGEFVVADYSGIRFEDPGDKKFYEVAVTGGADYLATGNIRHLTRMNPLSSPRKTSLRENWAGDRHCSHQQ